MSGKLEVFFELEHEFPLFFQKYRSGVPSRNASRLVSRHDLGTYLQSCRTAKFSEQDQCTNWARYDRPLQAQGDPVETQTGRRYCSWRSRLLIFRLEILFCCLNTDILSRTYGMETTWHCCPTIKSKSLERLHLGFCSIAFCSSLSP